MDGVMSGRMERAGEASLVHEFCSGLIETKQSWALQDHGYMIWAPEDAELPRASDGVAVKADSAPRTLVWWDTETCPAPIAECNAWDDMVEHLMRMLALQDMNQREVVTCIAYGAGEVSESLLLTLNRRGIVVHRRNLPTCTLPGAGTTLSMKSMIVDILFWALNNAPPAEVRIISATNEPNFLKLVRGLERRSYGVFLASSFTASLTQPATGNGEYVPFSNDFADYSFVAQIPEFGESLESSLEQFQLWNSCLITEPVAPALAEVPVERVLQAQRQDYWANWQVSQPRPTYRDVASGVELSNQLSSLWKGDSKTGTGPAPRASMDDVRGWLELFVELEDSLYGMNISLMSKSFDRRGMKLDLKHLGCPSLSRLLLDNFSDIVRLKYPTKDCTFMFPANLGAQARGKLIADFTDLLTHLLPKRDSESPMSTIKTAFRARFHYELDHEAAGYMKLSQFLSSMPKLVRVRQCSSQGKELVICRPSGYYSKQRT
ncbi:hypothetical protein M758_1G116200 [Ceratodon purpureus]|nr:hypothetical protein M758_1G116200 [Ceratodon purpureus]KAG0629603.1 hypothetical protein M758_1G116200 [Ceratodon purpureus]